MDKRVLFVAYLFPPVGGAGVQRVTKFVKYLPQHGWLPSVLTVANPSVPLFDDSMGADIPAPTIVRRAKTWEPGYGLKSLVSGGASSESRNGRRWAQGLCHRLSSLLLQPDPQVLWIPEAIRHGRQLLGELAHAAIVVTAPPFSAFFAGAVLARQFGLPLILDYRDEWTLTSAYGENRRQDPFSRRIQDAMQRRVVRGARALVATTRASALALEHLRKKAGSNARVTYIYNGFDPDDFFLPSEDSGMGGNKAFRLSYVGTLWNLTSVAPLVAAVQRLFEQNPDFRSCLELSFVGRRTGPQQKLLDNLKQTGCRIVETPYVEHQQSVNLLRSADALCLLLSDLPGAERVVPAKIFEYLAAKKPILAIAPRGETWDLLKHYPAGSMYAPGDVEGICHWLTTQIRRHQEGCPTLINGWDASRFGRDRQAGQLADLLDDLVTRKTRT